MKPLLKPVLLGFVIFVLLIPLAMIENLVRERAYNRTTVSNELAQTDTRPQVLHGPWLVVNYQVSGLRKQWDKEAEQYVMTEWKSNKHMLLRPKKATTDLDMTVTYRYRGIYKVPVYDSMVKLDAEFDLEPLRRVLKDSSNPVLGEVFVEVGVADARGFNSSPKIVWNDRNLESIPGVSYSKTHQGFRTRIADFRPSSENYRMSSSFGLAGINSFEVAPSGYDSQIRMQSNWPHPSFMGSFLPDNRSITEKGFEADWAVSAFATGARMEAEVQAAEVVFRTPDQVKQMGVKLFDPVDIYTLSDRATKYGILFIVLTFAAFYLFEVLKKKSLHPIQYVLVGLALAVFFLMLLSLSEHIGFGYAYLLATIACVGLVSFYVIPVVGKTGASALGAALLGLFGICYVILMLEGHALLVGSILIFLVLGVVMLATRKIDWSGMTPDFSSLSRQSQASREQQESVS